MNREKLARIPLIKPYITPETKKAVLDVLDSGQLTEGAVTRDFEAAIAALTGAGYALAVTSCTTGLELALRALGIGSGDEVIVPDYTYPATADAVVIVGAVPVLADVNPETMLLDARAAEKAMTSRTRCIMPVSLFGNPLDYDWLNDLKARYGLCTVEDAACSLGAVLNGRMVGTFADISVFSLHPRKFITTGEGGVITTDNSDWAAWMNSYKHFGMETPEAERGEICFARIGTNYKLSNVQAAIGLAQLRDFAMLIGERRGQAALYRDLLAGERRIALPETTPGGEHSWQTFCVFVEERDRIWQTLRDERVEVQIGTYAVHAHPAFAGFRRVNADGGSDLAGSRQAFAKALALPMYHGLSPEEQEYVAQRLQAVL